MTGERYDIEVCVDCAMLIANGETPEDNPEFCLSPRWDGYHVALNCPEECYGGFSMSSCDGCDSRLGGDRHPAVAWDFGGPTPMPGFFDTLQELLDGKPEPAPDPDDWRDNPAIENHLGWLDSLIDHHMEGSE